MNQVANKDKPANNPCTGPKFIPLTKIINAVKKTGSITDAGKLLGMARTSIYERLNKNNIDIDGLRDFTEDKASSHEILQYRIAKNLSEEDIKKMPGGTKVLALCQLEDKIRLISNKSTENVSILSKMVESAHDNM